MLTASPRTVQEVLRDKRDLIWTSSDTSVAVVDTTADPRIRLTTRVARYVTLAKKRYRIAISVAVADNGPGVPDALRERIFYPLVSGREGGSGLGLTIAQTLIAQHNGTIECQSMPGHTVFTILLPLECRAEA